MVGINDSAGNVINTVGSQYSGVSTPRPRESFHPPRISFLIVSVRMCIRVQNNLEQIKNEDKNKCQQ